MPKTNRTKQLNGSADLLAEAIRSVVTDAIEVGTSGLREDVNSMREDVNSLREDVNSLRGEVTDLRVDLTGRIDSLEKSNAEVGNMLLPVESKGLFQRALRKNNKQICTG